MNTIAWNSTEMEIIVKMKDVGLIPPGSSSEGRSAYVTAPDTGSTERICSPSPSTHCTQLVWTASSSNEAQDSGRAVLWRDHANVFARSSTNSGTNTCAFRRDGEGGVSVTRRENEKTSKVTFAWARASTADGRWPEASGPRAYRHGALEERRVGKIVQVPPHELAPKRFRVLRRRHGDHARRVLNDNATTGC